MNKHVITRFIPVLGAMTIAACAQTRHVDASARSTNSDYAEVEVAVKGDEMKVTLTNRTTKTRAVDKEMELHFSYEFEGEGLDRQVAHCGHGERGKPLSERIVLLKPNESITKVFRSGDVMYSYYVMHAVPAEGVRMEDWPRDTCEVLRSRVPDLTKIDEVLVEYSSGGADSRAPSILSSEQHYDLPEETLDGVASINVKLTDDPHYELKTVATGDKELWKDWDRRSAR